MTYSPPLLPLLSDDHKAIAYETYQSMQTGFRAPEGSPTVAILEAASQLTAETAVKLTLTAEELTRQEAALRGISRDDAVSATLQATYVASDALAHIVEGGGFVTVTTASGQSSQWIVQSDIPFTTSTLSGEVTLVAATPGAGLRGTFGTVVASQPKYAWLQSITLTGPAVGGADAETPGDFLTRVGAKFIVGSDLILKADQLAVQSETLPGVGIARARRTYNPAGPDAAAPGHMTVAVADDDGNDFPSAHPIIEAFPTADCNKIHAVDFDRHPVKITATVVKRDDYPDPAVVKAQCEAALLAWVKSWGQRQQGDVFAADIEDMVLMDQVAAILNNELSVKRVSPYADVKIGVDGGSVTHSDKTLTGDFPLAYVATPATDIVVTVT